jgi:ABC-2 type transport system permease protein
LSGVLTIVKRELSAYLNTPLGAVILAVFLGTFGFFFFFAFDVFASGVASARGLFAAAPLVLAILAPIVSMRLMAEERSAGTLELLLTWPLTEWQIVLGKYLAGVALVGLGTLGTLPFVASVALYGDLDPGPVLGGYLGLLWMGGAYVALGLLCSALANSQIVAALTSLLLCVGVWIADKLAPGVPGLAGDVLRFVGFDHHFSDLQRGVVDSRDLVFFGSVIVLCLAGAVLKLRRLRLAR